MRQARARHNRIRDVIKVETRVFLLLCRTCNLCVFETPIRYTFMYSNNGYLIVILLTSLLSSRQSIVLLKYVFCFSDGSYIERCEQAMGPTLIKRSLEPTNPWQLRNYRTKIQCAPPWAGSGHIRLWGEPNSTVVGPEFSLLFSYRTFSVAEQDVWARRAWNTP